ncbi:GMC family oxidoreductase [Wenzhouxiangella marina]|uniref:Choline dehydrogenase n=1 Tax=Wenzhouxiangella marina TaxID=1579979 RepID=A0A0K0XSW5_9GAMM|nr:choline dehydrogenase [Wenzhouxiangella marina]AKS40711.1 Choline dehydrogenase [Wenzhouxiangella marina]MBB6088484.1 choline dehydrogenase [Wenzhouxiangella marina]
MPNRYDYIIVGAGSAGCVLAHRLSADPSVSVLLLEAGPRDWNPFIHMPAGLAKLVNFKSLNWNYETEPEPALNNRRLYWPRGKVLGGSSSINAMCYSRGHRSDYEDWAALGNPGWAWKDVLPYFMRAEDQSRGADDLHGVGGPLSVSDLSYTNPLSDVFIQAAEQAGFARNRDFNGPAQRGVGFYQVTQRNGRRCSTAAGYLKPVRSRPNLTVITGALTLGLTFSGPDRVRGVRYAKRGIARTATAEREVLLAAGAINSPQLMMLSGIGPAGMLETAGVRVRHELTELGRNLQDHLDICTLTRCSQPVTYDQLSEIRVGLRYFLHREGEGTSNIAEAGAFLVSGRGRDDRPDVQMHFVPALLDDHGRNRLPGDGYTLHACPLRPESRGHLALRSADPRQPIAIHANYLSEAEDLEMMLDCVRLSREILDQPAFKPFRAHEIFPGNDVTSRTGLIDFIRNKAETIYHPVGTCRMGSDPHSVVDPELRVRGIEGLRVIDASIMPTLVGGNTNAPTVMIAEKAADLILGASAARTESTARAA